MGLCTDQARKRAARWRFRRLIRSIVVALLYLAAIILAFSAGIYWVLNPELTQMQFFLKTWWCQVGIFVLAGIATYIDR